MPYFQASYFFIKASKTPLVQPKPSCPPYSPPPASSFVSTTLYFSISLPVRLKTSEFNFTHRCAMSLASSFCPQRSSPQIVIHSNGAHPFGASHCWALLYSTVTTPPSFSNLFFNAEVARAHFSFNEEDLFIVQNGYMPANATMSLCFCFLKL